MGWDINRSGNKRCYVPKVNIIYVKEDISKLKSLKVLYLACKRVFYRPERKKSGNPMELNCESLQK